MGDGCLPSADPQKFIISLTTPFWYTRRKEVVILCCFSLPFVSCLTILVAYKVEANVNKQPKDGRPSTNGDEGGKAFLQRTTQSLTIRIDSRYMASSRTFSQCYPCLRSIRPGKAQDTRIVPITPGSYQK